MRMCIIKDLTTGYVLADETYVADTFLTRGRGLLLRPQLVPGEGLLIKPCRAVHTHGMRYPIDVLFADDSGRVVRVEQQVPPGRFAVGHRKSRLVVELPPGIVGKAGVQVGHILGVGQCW
jgi:uncharacterized membrane protein (UPF0127 family)